jgi:hypothetical protein
MLLISSHTPTPNAWGRTFSKRVYSLGDVAAERRSARIDATWLRACKELRPLLGTCGEHGSRPSASMASFRQRNLPCEEADARIHEARTFVTGKAGAPPHLKSTFAAWLTQGFAPLRGQGVLVGG